MAPINIKIRKSNPAEPEPTNVLNLTSQPAEKQAQGHLKKYLWLLLALLIGEALIIAALYFKQPSSPYLKILPSNLIATSYFDQSQISSLFKSLKSQGYDLPILSWSENELKNLADKANIESTDQLLSLFDDQAAFALVPGNDQRLNWMLLASIKVSGEKFSELQDATERDIKQNFNITNEDYRQIKITKVQNLNQGTNSLYYARVKNYFIATNNVSRLKESIDLAIK